MKENGEPIAMVTAYDYTSARIIDDIGFDAILVGESLLRQPNPGFAIQQLLNQ